MRSTYFCRAAFVASMLQLAVAQGGIPTDITTDFKLQLQVSYTNDASNGFKDGTTFSKDEVAEEPTFALGDSDGIAPSILYTVIMIDTTDDNARTLQYARANFKHSEGVKLESDTQPLLEYKAPGTAGETGSERKISFLMYRHPQRNEIQSLTMPGDGEAFDAKKFQDDNGLNDPTGGLSMVVSLDGSAAPAPSSAPSSTQRPNAPAAPSSTTAPSSAAAPSSTNAPSSATAPADAEPSSATSTRAPASTTAAQDSEAAPGPSTAAPVDESQAQTSANGPTTSVAPAVPTPSTVLLSTVVPETSATVSNAPAEQTANGAGTLSMPWVSCALLAPIVVFAGLVV